MHDVCAINPPVAPDTHLLRQTPACEPDQMGLAPTRHRHTDIPVGGHLRHRRLRPEANRVSKRTSIPSTCAMGNCCCARVDWGGRLATGSGHRRSGAAVADAPGTWTSPVALRGILREHCRRELSACRHLLGSLPIGTASSVPDREVTCALWQRANHSLQLTGRRLRGRLRHPGTMSVVCANRRRRPAAELNR